MSLIFVMKIKVLFDKIVPCIFNPLTMMGPWIEFTVMLQPV